jgi:hypothetical protein
MNLLHAEKVYEYQSVSDLFVDFFVQLTACPQDHDQLNHNISTDTCVGFTGQSESGA